MNLPSAFQSRPPQEIGQIIRALGRTAAEARSGNGLWGIIVGGLVGGGVWAATQFIRFGVRMDNTIGFTISTVLGLVFAVPIFLLFRLGKAEESVTFLGEYGIAQMRASSGQQRVTRLATYPQIADVRLRMTRHGRYGALLRKDWIFYGHDGQPLLALTGEGRMDPFSADPNKATTTSHNWAFAEQAIAQWQAKRHAR
jgi:hypothetical protein